MISENRGCFLGSAGAGCFFSAFDGITPEESGWYTFILKGGPGTGKSTIMKRTAEKAEQQGIACERVFCSSDTHSLDAVIFPALKACVVDGTAPHEMEPSYPGADSEITDLGFWSTEKLAESRERIISLTDSNRELHAKARRFLDVSFSVYRRAAAIERGCLDFEKAGHYATRLTAKSFPPAAGRPGVVTKRLFDAVTPDGYVFAGGYVLDRCESTVVFADAFGAAAAEIIGQIKSSAVSGGLDVTVSPSIAARGIKHLIIPELKAGFFTSDCLCPIELPQAKIIQSSRFFNAAGIKPYKERLSFSRKASAELLDEACELLARANEVHGELENIYIAAMDFSKTDEAQERLFAKLMARAAVEKDKNKQT